MPWILFDEADHRTPVPFFRLDSVQSRKVALDQYRGRDNLVILFVHDANCEACRKALASFAASSRDYLLHDAVVLAIIPQPVLVLQADAFFLDLPFPVLSDPQGATRQNYARLMDASLVPEEANLLFVLDQYGGPYAALIEQELDSPTLHRDVLKWLEYIGMQCPE